MRQLLQAFAWLGLIGGAAGALTLLVFGPPDAWTLVPAAAYAFGGLFWFALCSVLVQTLDRIEALHYEIKKLRA